MILIDTFKKYKDYSTRATRKEFNIFLGTSILMFILISGIVITVFGSALEKQTNDFKNNRDVMSIDVVSTGFNRFVESFFLTGNLRQAITDSNYEAHRKALGYYSELQSNIQSDLVTSSIIYIFFIPMLLPLMAVTVRRLHDLGLTGWLLPLIVAVWGVLFGFGWLVIVPLSFLIFKDGQRKNNRYGVDPKSENTEELLEPIPSIDLKQQLSQSTELVIWNEEDLNKTGINAEKINKEVNNIVNKIKHIILLIKDTFNKK